MKLLNLNTLEIESAKKITMLDLEIGEDVWGMSIKQLNLFSSAWVDKAVKDMLKSGDHSNDQIAFNFIFTKEMTLDDFESVKNLITSNFIRRIILKSGRKGREYRLAVPQKLSMVHLTQLVFKMLINQATLFNIFTIKIKATEKGTGHILTYNLV